MGKALEVVGIPLAYCVLRKPYAQEDAMQRFLDTHADKITGTFSCFDRVLFRGYLPLGWPEAMERFMRTNGLLYKDFKRFVTEQSEQLKRHAVTVADRAGRPYIYLNGNIRKEDMVKEIASENTITRGLVCVLAAVEACQSFKLAYGKGHPRIVSANRKCLCFYFYFIDGEFGLMHIRIQSWFPFTVQVCINGHNYVAQMMDRQQLNYRRMDNAFLSIENPERAQHFADRLATRNWPGILSAFARRVNPLLKDLLKDMQYYWVTDQAEFATDIMFKDPASLNVLYKKLLEHAIRCFSAEDVLTFLGRKLHGAFAGEVLNLYKKRWPGARVKHRMKENWIKMYDKHGCVLRIETVINHPYEFKVRRRGKRNGELVTDWFPMPKGVAYLPCYQHQAMAANTRYLDALSVVDDPAAALQTIREAAKPLHRNGRSYRGFNPALEQDVRLFAAVMRGEHTIMGFRNKDVRAQMFPSVGTDKNAARRDSGRVSRLLKRLHVHGLVAKIPRSRRWRANANGHALMSMSLTLHHDQYPQLLTRKAS